MPAVLVVALQVPHQDSTFLYTDPPSCVGLWLALEDATRANGCLWGLKGIHKQVIIRPGWSSTGNRSVTDNAAQGVGVILLLRWAACFHAGCPQSVKLLCSSLLRSALLRSALLCSALLWSTHNPRAWPGASGGCRREVLGLTGHLQSTTSTSLSRSSVLLAHLCCCTGPTYTTGEAVGWWNRKQHVLWFHATCVELVVRHCQTLGS